MWGVPWCVLCWGLQGDRPDPQEQSPGGMLASLAPAFGPVLVKVLALVGLLPIASWHPGVQQEVLCCAPLAGLLLGVLQVCRLVRCVQSRLCVRREKVLAARLAAEIQTKCQLIDKVWAAEEELATMQATLQEAQAQQAAFSLACLHFWGACSQAQSTHVQLRQEVASLAQQLREEQALQARQQQELWALQEESLTLQKMHLRTCTHLPGAREPGPAGP